ncbi:autophagy-related protein 22-2 [Phyllosticta citricarpa]|uniref:Autophagy-related protein n=2 Tax=Phyllosticta TaxID=121621 RepID=A0ABR1MH77_9PEZI
MVPPRQQPPPSPPPPLSLPSTPSRPPLPPRQSSTFSKLSFHSSYSADDEQSVIYESFTMDPDFEPGLPAAPLYPGEDTTPTSRRELFGFYIYGWAAEVFVVCGVGSFIPITLEQLAREVGVLHSDKTTPCKSSFNVPTPHPQGLLSKPPSPDAAQCVVYVLGAEINTASFAMYTFSISVLVQALLIISMSGAADHGEYRKTLLVTFAVIGSVATMLFLPVTPPVFVLGALLAIIANTAYGASNVLLNSFLPLLVRNHPTVRPSDDYEDEEEHSSSSEGAIVDEADDESTPYHSRPDSRTGLLRRSSTADFTMPLAKSPATPSQELALSSKISSYGIGIGYIAALLVQAFAIFLVVTVNKRSTNFSLRLVLFVVGAWWLMFTVPASFWLKSRPGPPLQAKRHGKSRTWLAYFAYSWKSLWRTIMHARKLKDVLLFLAGWFLLSDAIATVSGTAVLFAKTSLEMKPAAVALINVVVTISGIVGAFSWSRLSVMMGLKPAHTILVCICLFEIIPIYGLLGFIPAIRKLGVFGLQQPWEMYPLGAVFGFVLGGLSSYCRSLYGELIPPGFEAAFYALYAITDKGSSIFGPAVVGAITDRTGEIRPAFWFLAALVGLPFPLLLSVDVERGRADGEALSRALDETRGKEPDYVRRTSNVASAAAGEAEAQPLLGEGTDVGRR